jgi:streptomycin 6-kinase
MLSPDLLETRALQWDVTIDETMETPTSVIGFGRRGDDRVVLKITRKRCDESHAGEILQAFNGEGSVRVLESETGAVLLERLEPGNQLVELVRRGQDEDATAILANLMQQLSQHTAPPHTPTVFDWARGFDRYLAIRDKQIPNNLVTQARELYRTLANSQGKPMLLHGDLQHYNVLFDAARGWLSIDPKGVISELEYEVGSVLRNPVEQPELLASANTIERRLDILVDTLRLDRTRVIAWSFSQAVLSAIWDIEDGYNIRPDNAALRLARTLKPMLR